MSGRKLRFLTAAGRLVTIPLLLFNRPCCREVQKAVNTAQGLFQRWTELLQDPSIATREEIDWTTNELRNNLRSIEWDLEDLDETINILSVVLGRTLRVVLAEIRTIWD